MPVRHRGPSSLSASPSPLQAGNATGSSAASSVSQAAHALACRSSRHCASAVVLPKPVERLHQHQARQKKLPPGCRWPRDSPAPPAPPGIEPQWRRQAVERLGGFVTDALRLLLLAGLGQRAARVAVSRRRIVAAGQQLAGIIRHLVAVK